MKLLLLAALAASALGYPWTAQPTDGTDAGTVCQRDENGACLEATTADTHCLRDENGACLKARTPGVHCLRDENGACLEATTADTHCLRDENGACLKARTPGVHCLRDENGACLETSTADTHCLRDENGACLKARTADVHCLRDENGACLEASTEDTHCLRDENGACLKASDSSIHPGHNTEFVNHGPCQKDPNGACLQSRAEQKCDLTCMSGCLYKNGPMDPGHIRYCLAACGCDGLEAVGIEEGKVDTVEDDANICQRDSTGACLKPRDEPECPPGCQEGCIRPGVDVMTCMESCGCVEPWKMPTEDPEVDPIEITPDNCQGESTGACLKAREKSPGECFPCWKPCADRCTPGKYRDMCEVGCMVKCECIDDPGHHGA